MLSELNKDQCQRISLTAVDVAMNSASTVDNDTDAYFNVRQKQKEVVNINNNHKELPIDDFGEDSVIGSPAPLAVPFMKIVLKVPI